MTIFNSPIKVALSPPLDGKLPPGDTRWRWFNGSFENIEIEPLDFVASVAQGQAFTTWHKNGWRASKNYLLGQHIGLDFDTGDERSSIDFLMTEPFVARYASFLYTTPSHSDTAPRARVVFVLDTPIHQAKNYVLVSTAIIWLFAGVADRKTKDACRFFYGGRPGETDAAYLGNVLPLDVAKDVMNRYRQTGMAHKKKIIKYHAKNADERDVQRALSKIDPWGIEYDEWVQILMAIHSEFPGANGQAMADAWARGYDGEVERKWRSFDGAGGITIGTLFHIARRFGYERSAANLSQM